MPLSPVCEAHYSIITKMSANFNFSQFSADAPSFVPFSANAPEFVPSFLNQAQAQPQHFNPYAKNEVQQYSAYGMSQCQMAPMNMQMNQMISLDGYSDESSDDEQPQTSPPVSKSAPAASEQPVVSEEPEEPGTPCASTCDPTTEPEFHDSSSDLSDKEPESTEGGDDVPQHATHEVEIKEEEADCHAPENANVQSFSITTLLQFRHSVDCSEGLEDALTAQEPTPQEREAIEKDMAQSQAAATAPAKAPRRDRPAPRGARGGAGKPSEDRRGKNVEKAAKAKERQRASADGDWRGDAAPKGKLESSDGSWMAQQVARRTTSANDEPEEKSDEEVLRTMKSILNKLTIEKFSVLSEKLVTCGVRTTMHLETLINEVFEKATTQHHFINMYADLCTLLNTHFVEHPITDDSKMTFKRILLNGCQAFFERHLKPPADLETLDEEERNVLERKYKMRMLGNIKFVGALLVRQMLASKVMFAILEELLHEPLPETLESAAALLTIIGPKFDTPEWPSHAILVSTFRRVAELSKAPSVNCRVRFLLKDVLELRASKWEDKKPKKTEGPTTLKAVADSQAAEETATGNHAGGSPKGQKTPSGQGGKRGPPVASNVIKRGAPAKPAAPKGDYQRINSLAGLLKNRDPAPEQAKSKPGEPERPRKQPVGEPFDKDACLKDIFGALSELRVSHEVKEATTRVSGIAVPSPQQAEVLCDVLGHIAEEGSEAVRKICFELVTSLFAEGHWKALALGKGIHDFVEEVCPDLKCDVPTLPKILRDELHPALTPLVDSGVLKAKEHASLIAV